MVNPPYDAQSRPTLPGIQDLLSDSEFNRLHLQSADNRPNANMTSMATLAAALPQVPDARLPSHSETPPLHGLPVAASPRSPQSQRRRAVTRSSPYPSIRHSPPPPAADVAGIAFEDHLPSVRNARLQRAYPPTNHPGSGRPSALQVLAGMDLPTYVLSADQCPPDDDRRHGCGICNRRFNRPSSLMIHMNSHTGAQPFECPFPGCKRRFSVNSNMRRHYRNHREGAPPPTALPPYSYSSTSTSTYPYPHPSPSYSSSSSSSSPSRPPAMAPYGPYPRSASNSTSSASSAPSSSAPSSPAHTDNSSFGGDHDGDRLVPGPAPGHGIALRLRLVPEWAGEGEGPRPAGRTRARSEAPPATHAHDSDRRAARPRSCTVPGCECNEAPLRALRPAFAFHPAPSLGAASASASSSSSASSSAASSSAASSSSAPPDSSASAVRR